MNEINKNQLYIANISLALSLVVTFVVFIIARLNGVYFYADYLMDASRNPIILKYIAGSLLKDYHWIAFLALMLFFVFLWITENAILLLKERK